MTNQILSINEQR